MNEKEASELGFVIKIKFGGGVFYLLSWKSGYEDQHEYTQDPTEALLN
jgi:hypothetical protein